MVFAVCFCSQNLVFAQLDTIGVMITLADPSCEPPDSNSWTYIGTGNAAFDNILNSFNATSYLKKIGTVDSYKILTPNPVGLKNALSTFSGSLNPTLIITNKIELLSCTKPISTNDPFTDHLNPSFLQYSKWHLEEVEASCAWDITSGNNTVKIAIIDVGFDENHYDLVNTTILARFGNNMAVEHATTTVGTVCAETNNNLGISSLGYGLKPTVYEIANPNLVSDAIHEAIKDGNRVINVSMTAIDLTRKEVEDYVSQGIIFVLAAGNKYPEDRDAHLIYRDVPGVIIVSISQEGSTFRVDNDNPDPSKFRTVPFNEDIDLCAPGWKISHLVRTKTNGSIGNQYGWGSSFSAPMVTATVGLMLSVNPNLTPIEVECILKSTTDPLLNDVPGNAWYGKVGTGRLNAFRAVEAANSFLNAPSIPTTITGPVTFSGPYLVGTSIAVLSGGTLILTNAQVSFMQDVGIVVWPGGSVHLLNTTLQSPSNCESLWTGIRVMGDGKSSYNDLNGHGLVTVVNSTIQNAKIGIDVSIQNPFFGLKQGGIFTVTNSDFNNCYKGIVHHGYIDPFYPNKNPSFIKDSRFHCSQPFADYNNKSLSAHISLTNVMDIKIVGCEFYNDMQNSEFNWSQGRGIGISAFNSNFRVSKSNASSFCANDGDASIFQGLSVGIRSGYSAIPTSNQADRDKQQYELQPIILGAQFVNNVNHIDLLQDRFAVIYNNDLIWNNDADLFINNQYQTNFIGLNNVNSRASFRFDNRFLFNKVTNFGSDYFVGNVHHNDAYSSIFIPNSGTVFNYPTRDWNNNYFSASHSISSVGDFFSNSNEVTAMAPGCNTYNANMQRGWFLNPSANIDNHFFYTESIELSSSGYINEKRKLGNDFQLCQNSTTAGFIPNLSIDARLYPHPRIQIYDLQLNSNCYLPNQAKPVGIEFSNAFTTNPVCASVNPIVPEKIMCAGLDGVPYTYDEKESTTPVYSGGGYGGYGGGLESGESGGGSNAALIQAKNDLIGVSAGLVPEDDIILGVLNELGFSYTDILLSSNEVITPLTNLFYTTTDFAKQKAAQNLLSHFFDVNLSITAVEDFTLPMAYRTQEGSTIESVDVNADGLLVLPKEMNFDEIIELSIYTILGQKIEDNLYQFSDHKINTKGLPKGVYVLVCRTNTEVNNYKFTKH